MVDLFNNRSASFPIPLACWKTQTLLRKLPYLQLELVAALSWGSRELRRCRHYWLWAGEADSRGSIAWGSEAPRRSQVPCSCCPGRPEQREYYIPGTVHSPHAGTLFQMMKCAQFKWTGNSLTVQGLVVWTCWERMISNWNLHSFISRFLLRWRWKEFSLKVGLNVFQGRLYLRQVLIWDAWGKRSDIFLQAPESL